MNKINHLHHKELALAEAMRLAQLGDKDAYQRLLHTVGVLLESYVKKSLLKMGLLESYLTEDLVQEILLALHTKRHTYDPAQLFTPWLFAIARYKIIDFGRKKKKEPKRVSEDIVAEIAAPIYSDLTTVSDLGRITASLPIKTREILELIKVEGLSVAEVAAQTKMSESSIKVRVHRALKKLRAIFEGEKKKNHEP